MIRLLVAEFVGVLILAGTALGQAGYTVQVFDVPDTDVTSAGPINDAGDVAGFSGKLNPDGTYAYVGYLRSAAGIYTTLVPPGATGGIFAIGINNYNEVAGQFDAADGTFSGFIYKDGGYKVVRIKDSNTGLFAINDKGAIVGQFSAVPATFVTTPDGSFHFIKYPGAQSSGASSINDHGDLIGTYLDDTGFFVFGFLLSNGVFTSIAYPGSLDTELAAINNAGTIAGFSQLNNGYWQGILYRAGSFTLFNISGALSTYVGGINNLGQLSGNFVDSSNVQHGFIATPVPE